MLRLAQYNKIIALHNQGHSIRNIEKRTGHARKTIRRVLRLKGPPPPRAYSRPYIIDDYKDTVKEYCGVGTFTAQEIYDEIKTNGYNGSYSTVYRYVCSLAKQNKQTLRKYRPTNGNGKEKEVAWVLSLLQGKISINELEELFEQQLDIKSINQLYKYILENSLRYRNRALTIFAYSNKFSKKSISEIVGIERHTVRVYIKQFESGGTSELFDFSRRETKKYDEAEYKDKVFKILHSPPSYFKFNRTAWRLEDLYQTMKAEGFPLSKPNITKIIKNAGYRFIKAKRVLTSNDPLYREKLQEITTILSNLKPNEKFFSIDEFGPLAIKIRGGRSWTPPEDHKIIPQWQQSKGSLIVTAALELSTNQITHFYSAKKNTTEMIALLEILLRQYKDEARIFLSWDGASWHASRKLYDKVQEVNAPEYRNKHNTPHVELAPLPSSAQFLNVIESVFSGMAKAIIHNSNYQSVDECKLAINRYFSERNQAFVERPKRAGKKIWGREAVEPVFKESNNCKDSHYR